MTRRQPIRTLLKNPYCTRPSVWSWNATSVRGDDGRYTYTAKDASKDWAVAIVERSLADRYGYVQVAVLGHEPGVDVRPDSFSTVRWMRTGDYSPTICWAAAEVSMIPNGTLFNEMQYLSGRDISVTLLGAAYYTPTDWKIIEQLMDDGKIPGPWTAPPMSIASGVRTLPVLVP